MNTKPFTGLASLLIFLASSCSNPPSASSMRAGSGKNPVTSDDSSGKNGTKKTPDDTESGAEAGNPDLGEDEVMPDPVDEHSYPASFSFTNIKDQCLTIDSKYRLNQKPCNAAEFDGVQAFRAQKLGENRVNIKVVTRFTYNITEYCLGLDKGSADDNALLTLAECSESAKDQVWRTVKVSDGVFQVASMLNEKKCLNAAADKVTLKDCQESSDQEITFLDSTTRADLAKAEDNAPNTIKEDWFEHVETLYKMYEDKDIVIYGDAEWKANPKPSIHEYTKKAWSYFTKRFGNMGGYRLYAVYHGNSKYSGGHPDTYFKSRHHYRNFLDVGASSWPSSGINATTLNILVHEMAHIVENQMFGVRGSPGVVLWGDNKIYEMILYDVYTEMNEIKHRDAAGANWATQNVSTNASGAAKPGTRVDGSGAYWFRDWSLPLWKEFGGEKSIVNFFALTSKYFPKDLLSYKRSFNWGEYCHFMSGAVGKNMKERMTIAFGWDAKREAEFQQAKKDFPEIQY